MAGEMLGAVCEGEPVALLVLEMHVSLGHHGPSDSECLSSHTATTSNLWLDGQHRASGWESLLWASCFC